MFILRAQPHAQFLFLFPIVFGINLIHFFLWEKDGAAGNSIVYLLLRSTVSHRLSRHLTEAKRKCELLLRVQRFGNGKCELSTIQEGRKKCHFFGKEKWKTIHQCTCIDGPFCQHFAGSRAKRKWSFRTDRQRPASFRTFGAPISDISQLICQISWLIFDRSNVNASHGVPDEQ